ncbi:MAG TPA: YetF domain-containing protein [Gemmatimonadaceae bacterium]
MERRRPSGTPPPRFGESEAFDRIAHRVRVAAWWIILPALGVAAFLWKAPGNGVPSTVLRAAIIYVFVLVVVRLAGKRTLAELSTFDLVVLLILSEGIQPALVADDSRLTSAMIIVLTIVGIDALFGLVKFRSTVASKLLDDIPTVLVRDGVVNEKAMARERLDTDDILEAARRQMGLERFDQVRFAILERTGGISVIPWPPADATPRAR